MPLPKFLDPDDAPVTLIGANHANPAEARPRVKFPSATLFRASLLPHERCPTGAGVIYVSCATERVLVALHKHLQANVEFEAISLPILFGCILTLRVLSLDLLAEKAQAVLFARVNSKADRNGYDHITHPGDRANIYNEHPEICHGFIHDLMADLFTERGRRDDLPRVLREFNPYSDDLKEVELKNRIWGRLKQRDLAFFVLFCAHLADPSIKLPRESEFDDLPVSSAEERIVAELRAQAYLT